jgi:hypothetical protein
MKRVFQALIILLQFAILTVGCNRYEDGPMLSIRGKKDRLLGQKRITLYEVNGIDSTAMIDSVFENTSYPQTGFLWYVDEEDRLINCTDCISGYWNFQDDKQDLRLSFPMPLFSREIIPSGNWTILRLSNQDLWLRLVKNSNSYFLKFASI